MKKSKFTEEQILFALKQADAGQPMGDVCRQMKISEATFLRLEEALREPGILEVRELRQLRDENARLKRLVADLTLDRHVLQEVIKKRSGDGQAPRYRTMDTRLLSVERAQVMQAEQPAAKPRGIAARRHATAVFCGNECANFPPHGLDSDTSVYTFF